MAWRSLVSLPSLIVSSLAVFGTASVRADEAFLCGTDTIVYVKTADLEQKKRTDPCIAGYFGLKVEDTSPPAAKQKSDAEKTLNKPSTVIESKPLDGAKKRRLAPPQDERSTALRPALPAAGTDYRHVRILNASAAGEQWFRHER